MKSSLLTALMVAMLAALQPKHQVSNLSSPRSDQQNTSTGSVPDAYAIPGKMDQLVVLRIKYNTDLLAGIEQMVSQQQIRNGVILAGIGSVRGYQIDQASSHDLPSKNTVESQSDSPAELVGMNGYIIDGRVHAHVSLATPAGAIGGHLQKNTQVLTCAIVTVAVMNSANFNRIDDQTYR